MSDQTARPDALDHLPPRPSFLDSIAVARRAAKGRRCDSCGEPIPKGSLYVRHALPPHSDIGNTHWWVMGTCSWRTNECRRYWEVDSRELRGEPHVLDGATP